jgi:hypothetical protein
MTIDPDPAHLEVRCAVQPISQPNRLPLPVQGQRCGSSVGTLAVMGRWPALAGEADEEPLAEHVAERRKQRRWSCAWLHDGGNAPSAVGHGERRRALCGQGGSNKEASDIKAPEDERPLSARRALQRRPPWPIRRIGHVWAGGRPWPQSFVRLVRPTRFTNSSGMPDFFTTSPQAAHRSTSGR